MMDFHDVSFPSALAYGASGGPEFTTQITQLSNGREHRNTPHALPRRRYNAVAGIKSKEQIAEIMSFFMSRKGRLHSFRFHDPFDDKSCAPHETPQATDQILGVGDGERREFQLCKHYDVQSELGMRPITKPRSNSVIIAVDGTDLEPSDFSLDDLTGGVTLNTAPPVGSIVSAGFIFDMVVRFDTDLLDMTLEDFGAGQLQYVPLVELPYA